MLLAEYNTEVPQAEQIRLLCEKIMTDKADFNAATITMLMDGNHITFADAVAHISQYVSHFFPASSTFAWHGKGNFSVVNVLQIAQERRGERYLYNGVDITDFTRRYTFEECLKIKDLWPQIQVEKDHKSVGKMDGKAKALHKPVAKSAKALHKKIKSLTKKVVVLQDAESGSQGGASDMGDGAANDDNIEATCPRAFGKKCKAGNRHECQPPRTSIGPIKVHNSRQICSTSITTTQTSLINNDSKPVNYNGYLDEDSMWTCTVREPISRSLNFRGINVMLTPSLTHTRPRLVSTSSLLLLQSNCQWAIHYFLFPLLPSGSVTPWRHLSSTPTSRGMLASRYALAQWTPARISAFVTEIGDSTFHSTDTETLSASVRTSLTLTTFYRPCRMGAGM